ncbi:phosphatidate cytidylyltransferase [candidate division WOR-3 bacterium]|nr:phosphatidate cytidylyltransferase [candidate division WOR-3 bacterium]
MEKSGSKDKGFWGRLLVWLLLIPLTLATAAGPIWVVAIYALLWICVASFEYIRLYLKPFKVYHLLFIISPIIVWVYSFFPQPSHPFPLSFYLLLAVCVQFLLWLSFFNSEPRLLLPLLFLPFYLGFLPTHFVLLKTESVNKVMGYAWLVFPFVMNWVNDTAAYFSGKLLGRHRLSPKLSPRKTIEGLVGGLVCTAGLGVGFGLLFIRDQTWWQNGVLALAVGLSGTIGDLLESGIKRERGVKNTSNILAGHGGFLDRIDSLIFAVPVYYYFYIILEML